MNRSTRQSHWQPYFALILGGLAVSSASIFTRFAQDESAPSLVIAAWRLLAASLILTPIILARHRQELTRLTRPQIVLAVLSGIMLSFHFASWITSLEYTSVITSVVLVTTNPLFVALMSPLLLREKLSRPMVVSVLIAILGGIIVSVAGNAGTAPHQNAPLFGAVLALIGAISVAGYFIIGRRLRSSVSVITYIWLTYSTAAIALCLMVLVARLPVAGLDDRAYLWMTLLALGPQLIGHSSYNYALGYLSAAYVSLAVLIEPIGSTILAALFLKEYPATWQLVGGALILAALLLASRDESRSMRLREELEVSAM